MTALLMDKPALEAFMEAEFPQVAASLSLREVAPYRLVVALTPGEGHLRPGNTVSGPTMFGLADVGVYLAILAMIGPKALTVTTSASIDFMRKPPTGREVRAQVEILKLGKALAVGDARLFAEVDGAQALVARATLTYSIPKN